MARATGAATTVLESIRLLHDLGDNTDLAPGDVMAALRQIGVVGFTDGQEPYFAMLGTVLRLLMRHAETDVTVMFARTLADLQELGRDIDHQKFEEIVTHLSDEGR